MAWKGGLVFTDFYLVTSSLYVFCIFRFLQQNRLFSALPKEKANIMEASNTVNVFFEDVSLFLNFFRLKRLSINLQCVGVYLMSLDTANHGYTFFYKKPHFKQPSIRQPKI